MKFGKMKEGLANVKNKVSDATSSIAEKSKEQMANHLPAVLQKVDDLQPILKDCGFIIDDMEVEISIPPSISITVVQEEQKLNRIKELLDSEELTKFQTAILKSINTIYSLNQTVGKYNYAIGEVEIGLSIPPSVVAHLSRSQ